MIISAELNIKCSYVSWLDAIVLRVSIVICLAGEGIRFRTIVCLTPSAVTYLPVIVVSIASFHNWELESNGVFGYVSICY